MRLVRTIHPVGHGCFCSERFYEDGGQNVFNVVYDCGSKTLAQQDLYSLTDAEFVNDSEIDILFISHFHDDHINGVDHLLSRCKVKKVVVPFVGQEGALLYMIHHFLYDNDPNNTLTPLIETLSLGNTLANNVPIERIEVNSTSVYGGASVNPYWKYKPVVSPPYKSAGRMSNSINGLVNSLLRSPFRLVIQSQSPLVVDYSLFRQILVVPINFHKLEKIYNYHRLHDNRFNMALFSGSFEARNNLSNCLFTGDYEAKYKYRINYLQTALAHDFNRLNIVQIPHHGSSSSHSIKLYKPGETCFVCDTQQSSRSNRIVRSLNCLGCILHKVTENSINRLSWSINI